MPANQFYPLATGTGANALTNAQWAALGTLLAQGFQSGVVPSIQFNTFLRQLSVPVSAIAQLMADNQSADVLDDGVVANFEAKLKTAIQNISAYVAQAGQEVFFSAGGSSTVYTGTLAPAPTSLTPDMEVLGAFGVANTTTSPTLNLNGLGAKPILKQNSSTPQPGDISGFVPLILNSAGSAWIINGLAPSDVVAQAAASGITSFSNSTATFTTAGSSTFTATYTGLHRVTGWGGGAGGGFAGTSTSAGGGGGAGGCGYAYLYLTKGQTYPLVVGAGGTGGTSASTQPTAGGTTSFNSSALASGGSPGVNAGSANQTGSGGGGGNGQVTGTGRNFGTLSGTQGYSTSPPLGGAGGSALNGGGSGGVLSLGTGNLGVSPGGGGGGAANAGNNGGNGAAGAVLIEW